MKRFACLLVPPLALSLAACGAEPTDNNVSADDFAARIKGNGAVGPAAQQQGAAPQDDQGQTAQGVQPAQLSPPVVAKPLPGAAPGAYVPGTLTDPNSATCGANLMGDYIGKEADLATKAAIRMAASGASEVRFVQPGQTIIPDPTSPRLSIMIDNLGIIRDARCG
ncbi:hypothetical protein INR77_09415 [Erythrobacter sp. SCSIO 43205]|uniref:I78 family peptidase inhibitor n=1 Tax=Erythrobacter sp. SCSIO 43205 TaxID=2779361 RepID=UPI001CA94E61|nr:I78 family peptidase inhibitor [Erythrobacter sp. SCSIO 43205]UAB77055.1 hypothetical protein INR77_09415 [Erythrobacter sp. SCSIO 43205]